MKKITKSILTAVLMICLISVFCLSAFAAGITKQQAINKAIANAGLKKSQVSSIEVEKEKNAYEIEFTQKKTGDKYEYEMLIKNGFIKEKEIEYAHKKNVSTKKVGKTAAIASVFRKTRLKKSIIKSGTIKYIKYNGEYVYQIRFKNGKYKFECIVLAPTGKVIEFSKKYTG